MGSNKDNLPNWLNKSSFYDLVDHMDSFFNESFKHINSFFDDKLFKVDTYETESNIVIEAVLPGYKRSQIQLEITGNQVRIAVNDSYTAEEKQNQSKHDIKRQSSHQMERLITLPFTISEENTKATYTDGILKITTPKRNPNTRTINIDRES